MPACNARSANEQFALRVTSDDKPDGPASFVKQTVSLRCPGDELYRLVTRDLQTNSFRYASPAMISRMTRLHGHKRTAASCRNFVVCDQFTFHYRSIVRRFNYACNQTD